MASLLLLSGGEDGSSADFYLEYLCTTSFRQFHEPLSHTAARQLSPSMPRLVRAAIIPWARMAPALRRLEPLARPWGLGQMRVAWSRRLARYRQQARARTERPCHHR
jgi:hypothetical protein